MPQNAAQGSFLVIVQPALPSATPSQTGMLVSTAAGLLGGLLLGVILAIILELLDTHVGTEEALNQLLGWPILGTIWQAGHGEDVINPIDQDSNVESYSILRTNIGFAAIDKPLQTLVVTVASLAKGGLSPQLTLQFLWQELVRIPSLLMLICVSQPCMNSLVSRLMQWVLVMLY